LVNPLNIELNMEITSSNIRDFLSLFIHPDGAAKASLYNIDFSHIRRIDPVGVTALINLCYYLVERHNCRLQATGNSSDYVMNPGSRFLEDIGFYKQTMNAKFRDDAACPPTCRARFRLESERYHAWFYSEVTPWMSSIFGVNDDEISAWQEMYTVLGEIFSNIKDHAGSEAQIASVFLQHYPDDKNIHIAISDFGVGIPNTVRRVKPEIKDDSMAILQAVIDGFTSQSTPRNRGAGFDTLIKNIVHSLKGSVMVVSNFGEAMFWLDRTTNSAEVFTSREPISKIYPGTLIYLTMPTTAMPNMDNEDLSW